MTELSNQFEPSMVFDPSEFEGPRFNCIFFFLIWNVFSYWFYMYINKVNYLTSTKHIFKCRLGFKLKIPQIFPNLQYSTKKIIKWIAFNMYTTTVDFHVGRINWAHHTLYLTLIDWFIDCGLRPFLLYSWREQVYVN